MKFFSDFKRRKKGATDLLCSVLFNLSILQLLYSFAVFKAKKDSIQRMLPRRALEVKLYKII